MDLKEMSLSELNKLQSDIELAKAHAERKRIEGAKKAVADLMEKLNVTPEEVYPELARKRGKAASLPNRYVCPDDPTLRWSGHGRRPRWFVEQLEKGVTEEQMEI